MLPLLPLFLLLAAAGGAVAWHVANGLPDQTAALSAVALALLAVTAERAPFHLRGGVWTATFGLLGAAAAFSVEVAALAAIPLTVVGVMADGRNIRDAGTYAATATGSAVLIGAATTPAATVAQTTLWAAVACLIVAIAVATPLASCLALSSAGTPISPRRVLLTLIQPAALATIAISPAITAISFTSTSVHPGLAIPLALIMLSWSSHSHPPPPPAGSVRAAREAMVHPLMIIEVQQVATVALAHGGRTADALMEEVSTVIANRMGNDNVHRIAADRIAVQLSASSVVPPSRQARDLLTAIAGVRRIGNAEVPVTGRAALAVIAGGGDAIHEAELALTVTEGEVTEFREDMVDRADVTSSAALIEAVQPRSIELAAAYTPTVSREREYLDHLYAVTSWDTVTGQQISHPQLLAIAGRMGLQMRLSARLVEAVCVDLTSMDPQTVVDVALPPGVLLDPDFLDLLRQTPRRFGLPAHQLAVAIADISTLSPQTAYTAIERFHDAGVSLVADDVGSHGWSMHALSTSPISSIRVSPTLADGLAENRGQQQALEAIVHMATRRRLPVTLAGVTRRADAVAATAFGIERFMGPFAGERLSVDQLLDQVANRS